MPKRKSRVKTRRYNNWEIAAFCSFGVTALYIVAAIGAERLFTISLPGEFMLFPAAGFTFLGTTGALKKGEFFMEFGDCSREKAPISFWSSVIFGYLFTLILVVLFFL